MPGGIFSAAGGIYVHIMRGVDFFTPFPQPRDLPGMGDHFLYSEKSAHGTAVFDSYPPTSKRRNGAPTLYMRMFHKNELSREIRDFSDAARKRR
jgi:hypothetical protein